MAPDMAFFPRLNASPIALPHGFDHHVMGFFTAGRANFGWVAYAPLSNSINTRGGADLWIGGLYSRDFGDLTGVNLTATIFYLARPA